MNGESRSEFSKIACGHVCNTRGESYAHRLPNFLSFTMVLPRVFFDIESSAVSGRVFVELFSDKTPKACEK